jgi:hypothetical protein
MDIFDDAGMNATNSGEVEHRGVLDWQPYQGPTFQHFNLHRP